MSTKKLDFWQNGNYLQCLTTKIEYFNEGKLIMAYTGVYRRKDGRRKAKLILDCYDR
jgi:hypothetical protein